MRKQLEYLHQSLGACQAVADYLGYTLRGYMKIRHKVWADLPLPPRVEALIRLKAEHLASDIQNNEGVAPVTNHINTGRNSAQVEFDKALKRIKTMFQAGKNRKSIHAKLTEAGRITMSYPRFCVLMTKADEIDPFISTAVDVERVKTASSAGTARKGCPVKRQLR